MLSSHLETQEIRVFKTVCDTGGFKTAADRLYVTQSAVSQTIASLERKLGTRLIERGKPIALTESGTRLQAYAARVLQEEHAVLADIADIRQGVASTLQIAMSGSVSQLFGNELLEDYCDSNPLTRLKVDVMPSRKIIQGVLGRLAGAGLRPFPAADAPRCWRRCRCFMSPRKLVISRFHPRLARLLEDPGEHHPGNSSHGFPSGGP
jgi:DNA-binding transcriptional LysR family regulator